MTFYRTANHKALPKHRPYSGITENVGIHVGSVSWPCRSSNVLRKERVVNIPLWHVETALGPYCPLSLLHQREFTL